MSMTERIARKKSQQQEKVNFGQKWFSRGTSVRQCLYVFRMLPVSSKSRMFYPAEPSIAQRLGSITEVYVGSGLESRDAQRLPRFPGIRIWAALPQRNLICIPMVDSSFPSIGNDAAGIDQGPGVENRYTQQGNSACWFPRSTRRTSWMSIYAERIVFSGVV